MQYKNVDERKRLQMTCCHTDVHILISVRCSNSDVRQCVRACVRACFGTDRESDEGLQLSCGHWRAVHEVFTLPQLEIKVLNNLLGSIIKDGMAVFARICDILAHNYGRQGVPFLCRV